MQPAFAAIAFHDPVRAEANLARLGRRLAPTLMAPLASLLAQSPDPDGALNLLERYTQAAPADVLTDLARFPTALTYLVAMFGNSGFLAETFLADPGLPLQFARDRNFTKLKSKEDLMQDYARFSATSTDHWLSAQLAQFKRRNYLRIVLKDVLRLSTLGETTLELSALADVILTNTLIYCDQELEKRYGQPRYRDAQGRIVRSGFSIISLGKLGGNELNYSSDIDLLFLYSYDGETAGGSEPDSVTANKEYFVRLAHAITRTITQTTPQGTVFRVDLRLRPEGDQGDLAISLKSALEYYEHRARDWELQMLIKARHSAGDSRLTREFLRAVEPYIYATPGDFAAIESVLWAREKMSQRLQESRGEAIDVKLHRGGIRDIEFLTQCLQRLHGARDPWVRSGGTLFALRKLNDKSWLSDRDYARLTSAYEFLRKVEHRVQLNMGQQTHRLPTEQWSLDRLARRVGVEHSPQERPSEVLLRGTQEAFERVAEIYERVIYRRAVSAPAAAFSLETVPSLPADHVAHALDPVLNFLDAVAPELAQIVRHVSLSDRARKKVIALLTALLSSSDRFALAREHPEGLRRALEVAASSEYLAGLLIYHPEDLAVLDLRVPVPAATVSPGQLEIGLESGEELTALPWGTETGVETREKMALLRRYYRTRVLELAALDVEGLASVFAALRCWSTLAARCVSTALCIAADELAVPSAGAAARLPFVALGLGRLGLNEFDLASDADLVFVVASGAGREEIPLWTRLAEKTIEVLSTYTRDGTLFAVDTRLRPRGQEGELVVTEDAFLGYFKEAAHTWEALTYLKASPVAGNIELGRRSVSRLISTLMERFASCPDLAGELRDMRSRLEREVVVPSSNMKTASGGYYDIDFAISYLRLRHRVMLAPGANMEQQVSALRAANLLPVQDAEALHTGAAFLRSVDHAIRLVTGRAATGLPEHIGHADAVENLTRRWGLIVGDESLAERLRQTQEQVRQVYGPLLGSE